MSSEAGQAGSRPRIVPESALPGQPLTFCGYKIWRAPSGLAFDLVHRPRTGFITVDVRDGVIVQNPY